MRPPPEIAYSLGLEIKQVYHDISFLRGIQLNDLPLEIIRDMGTNFFEMKVRELQARISEEARDEKKDRAYILGLEKLVLNHKVESLKLQGAYQDPESQPTGPIQIIFTEVGPDYGKDTAKLKTGEGRPATQEAGGTDDEQEETQGDICEPEAEQDPEKEYPLY